MTLSAALISSVVAFASTNVDDLFVILSFLCDRSVSRRQLIAGQFAGIAVLTLVSGACAGLALQAPASYIRYLGVLPILLGLLRLRSQGKTPVPEKGSATGALAVTAVTIANGGDNIVTYVPLIAKMNVAGIVILVLVFAAMTAIWIVVARWLLSQPTISSAVSRWGAKVVPWVLIGLGLYILVKP